MSLFELSEEQEALVGLATDIATRSFKDKALTWQFTDEAPWKNIEILREAGLVGLTIDPEYGGGGRSPVDALLVTEAISSVCPTTGSLANSLDLGPVGIVNFLGSEEQKATYLPQLLAGTMRPCIALSEPEAGSELTALRTAARIEGDTCVINGQKVFSSGADKGDVYFVYVRFGPGPAGIGAVIVERDTPGLTVGTARHHMSGDTWAPLYFDDCRVPASNVLPLKNGFKDLISIYSLERTAAAAKCIGIAQCAMNMALEHAKTRVQFGQPIADFQGIRWKFADMAIRLDAARLLTYRAVSNATDGRPVRKEASMAKVAATEAAGFVCDESIQILGGGGISMETGLEWLYRLARGYRVAGGTSEIHRNMIAKEVLAGR